MVENPFTKLARLVGGAAMLSGPLGHQVLGQLLISGSTNTELAGANVVLAAVSQQTDAAVQIAVRSVVPAVLVEVLSRKEQQRIERLYAELKRLQKEMEDRSAGSHGKTEKDRPKDETNGSLEESLINERLKLMCQGRQPERRGKALRHLLDEYEPACNHNVPKTFTDRGDKDGQ